MIDRLVDLLVQFLGFFQFCTIVDAYEQGVILRFGKYRKTVDPGFHWLIPFYVDRLLATTVVTNTSNLGAQSLTLADGTQVVISTIVTWRVNDVRKLLLEVEGLTEALHDTAYGVIASKTCSATWAEVHDPAFCETVGKEVRKRAFRYGVEVMQVQFSDLSKTRSLRIWTGH